VEGSGYASKQPKHRYSEINTCILRDTHQVSWFMTTGSLVDRQY